MHFRLIPQNFGICFVIREIITLITEIERTIATSRYLMNSRKNRILLGNFQNYWILIPPLRSTNGSQKIWLNQSTNHQVGPTKVEFIHMNLTEQKTIIDNINPRFRTCGNCTRNVFDQWCGHSLLAMIYGPRIIQYHAFYGDNNVHFCRKINFIEQDHDISPVVTYTISRPHNDHQLSTNSIDFKWHDHDMLFHDTFMWSSAIQNKRSKISYVVHKSNLWPVPQDNMDR